MGTRQNGIRDQFNRSAAGSYDANAHVQRMMVVRLLQSLNGWKNAHNMDRLDILEIGCGTGALTEILVEEWPLASILAIDLAPAMLQAAEQRILAHAACTESDHALKQQKVHFVQADIETWAVHAQADSCDLIVSNACFQWLSNPKQTLFHLRRILRTGGLLVFTTFGPDTFHELHQSFHEAYQSIGMKPQRHGLSFHSAAKWESLLQEAGFSPIQASGSLHKETYASARDFLHSVKAMGASTSEAGTMRGLSARQLFISMYKEYEARFSVAGGVAATYDLVIVQAGTESEL